MANIPPKIPVKNPAVSVEDLLEGFRVFVLIKNRAMAEAKIEIPRISLNRLIPLSVNQDKDIKPIISPIMLVISMGLRSGPVVIRGDLLR